MSGIFSKSCEYAIQAMLYLAVQEEKHQILLKDISVALNIPYYFLSKVLQTLVRRGLVVSYKGSGGGFSLDRPSSEISLIDIIRAVDGEEVFNRCILGFGGCDNQNPCPLHESWKKATQDILPALYNKTLRELSQEMKHKLQFIEQRDLQKEQSYAQTQSA
ncbi:MAG: Rrf2 family transcriptional regulator [Ignavibacteriae bacterium]|nr:Rrf2 family transcriptional regulator [Ignavibacteriota bacterium]